MHDTAWLMRVTEVSWASNDGATWLSVLLSWSFQAHDNVKDSKLKWVLKPDSLLLLGILINLVKNAHMEKGANTALRLKMIYMIVRF